MCALEQALQGPTEDSPHPLPSQALLLAGLHGGCHDESWCPCAPLRKDRAPNRLLQRVPPREPSTISI
eukprot:11688677-Prorocentrum_lima.AAC.1